MLIKRTDSGSALRKVGGPPKNKVETKSGSTFGMIVVSAVMIFNVLKLTLNTGSPVVCVLSGSMEPAFYRGDVLLLNKLGPIQIGDIVVYDTEEEQIPIVHRVIIVQEKMPKKGEKAPKEGDYSKRRYLTNGDANPGDDRSLYKKGQNYINDDEITGRAFADFEKWIQFLTFD